MRVELNGNNGRCPVCAGHDGYLAVPRLWFGHCAKHQVHSRVTALTGDLLARACTAA